MRALIDPKLLIIGGGLLLVTIGSGWLDPTPVTGALAALLLLKGSQELVQPTRPRLARCLLDGAIVAIIVLCGAALLDLR